MRIKKPNKEDILCLGDIIPNPLVVDNSFIENYFSENFRQLMNNITNNSIPLLFLQYFGKSKNKKLNSFIYTMIDLYGLKKYDKVQVVDENGIDIFVGDNIPVECIDNNYYYSIKDIAVKSVCELIDKRYYLKWSKLFNTLAFEYNPIEPFSLNVKESTKDDLSSVNHNKKDGTNKKNISSENSSSGDRSSETIQDDITENSFGYNAGDKPIKQNKTENIYKDKNDYNDNNEYSENEALSVDETSVTNYTRQNKGERDTVRSGNIGNIPQQELVMRERNLWEYQIYDTIFKDLDKVLVIGTYR